MSDGNFNRQFLPKTELSSGLRAGKAQMRQKAEKAFEEIADAYFTEDQKMKRDAIKQHYLLLLRD